ncbi:MAG: hypothetical protein COB83_13080 [Gammaproteobacteria bacterium]|nr:MAG: hypothetical protein COB83_13080 [Gammaproteobacteria bacterium]
MIAKKVSIDEITPDDIGMIDSPFQHITEWESKNIYLPKYKELIASEYQELPRGRVVYCDLTKKVTVYMDSSLFSLVNKKKVINYFDITNSNVEVIWKKDSHYKTYNY